LDKKLLILQGKLIDKIEIIERLEKKVKYLEQQNKALLQLLKKE